MKTCIVTPSTTPLTPSDFGMDTFVILTKEGDVQGVVFSLPRAMQYISEWVYRIDDMQNAVVTVDDAFNGSTPHADRKHWKVFVNGEYWYDIQRTHARF